MFMIFMKFSTNKSRAPEFIAGHVDWLKQGFDNGVFDIAGSLQPQLGGGILARAASRAEVEARVAADPFVIEDVVSAEILELTPSRTSADFAFLLPGAAA
ncbi:YciI family protein [Ruegeria aquimaris]|uniref:YciI family protein n=1 Tax=Ruegeria aquimaris TaxID=2984333 RepID=A0ABT3ADZ1_9RHOB|nr:YciI family protein [Ruegeria sp. XHP0148]MCV2886894.1 YciI family protein [Ruegeria sp. XHP0148]